MKNKYCPNIHDANYKCMSCRSLNHQREDMEKEIMRIIESEYDKNPPAHTIKDIYERHAQYGKLAMMRIVRDYLKSLKELPVDEEK